VTTTLSVVIITILFFGTFMPVAQSILVPPQIIDKVMYIDDADNVMVDVANVDENDPAIQNYISRASKNSKNDKKKQVGSFSSDLSIPIAEEDSGEGESRSKVQQEKKA